MGWSTWLWRLSRRHWQRGRCSTLKDRAATILADARVGRLTATPDYGKPGHWLVWSPGGECSETTATSCTCAAFLDRHECACIALIREIERDGKGGR